MEKRTYKHTKRFDLRLNEKVYNRIKWLADTYANGNYSLWLTYASLNAPRTFIQKENLNEWIHVPVHSTKKNRRSSKKRRG